MKFTLALLLWCPPVVSSFTLQQRPSRLATSPSSSRTVCFSTFDYEYLPPNPNADPNETACTLPSSYPPGTPAGLRGEAVRSALLSGRCIGWDLSTEPSLSTGGVLQVQGKGMRDFLNNKLTQDFSFDASYRESCILDAKGRVVDRLRVSILNSETAMIVTSSGHSSQHLMKSLDPFIFPLDEIELKNWEQSFTFTLASPQWKDVQKVLLDQALPKGKPFSFPKRATQSVQWELDDETKVLVIPSTGLPSVTCVGYTLVFYGSSSAQATGKQMWKLLTSEANADGPIEVGALEYETLRIEAGTPAYGKEIGREAKTSPLELHWQDTINMDKGCYLGQEGIASIAKNPRGPPRILYSVVFEDEFNVYETQSRGDRSDIQNLTKPPRPGQKLFALGSNEQLSVGTLTSVAEAGGTGGDNTVGLALVRRADSIMKQMNALELEIPRDTDDFLDMGTDAGSGMIQPPPLDPLDGLEVIVEGTFTAGKLKMIPSRLLRKGRNMFDDKIAVEDFEEAEAESVVVEESSPKETEKDDVEQMQADAEKAAAEAEAEAAAADANRKAEKMEMLRKRAEEAMARRKKKKPE